MADQDEAPEASVWPDSFPTACPPEDAVPATGTFYRLVDADPCTPDDFLSQHDLVEAGKLRKPKHHPDECMAVGLSVNPNLAELKKTRGAFGVLKKKQIAKGDIDGQGLMKHTASAAQPSHHTWWRPIGDVAWKTFAVTP